MPQLPAVQVVRALAALAVVMHHVQFDAATIAEQTGQSFTRTDIIPWPIGVDVFFVISGFIMVHSSMALFGRYGSARQFLARRVARIVPLYWAATTLFLVVAALAPHTLTSNPPSLSEIVSSYLFFPFERSDGRVQPVYSIGWTLNYEMLFYVVFAAAIWLPKLKAVALVAAALGLAAVAGHVLRPLAQPFGFWTYDIILEFAFGMGLALLRSEGVVLPFVVRAALAALGVILFCLIAAYDLDVTAMPRILEGGVPATMLVAAAALGPVPLAPSRFESGIAMLGDASYSLYLSHSFVIRTLRVVVLKAGFTEIGPWTFIIAAIAAALIVSLLLHRYFEEPATRFVRRSFGVWGTTGRSGAALGGRKRFDQIM